MAAVEAVDFDVIEEHKENIQSLPGGRSAKALATLFTPPLTANAATPNDANNAKRAQFEQEIQCIDDADDPLDVYDRYIKWTIEAYPAATSNQLLPVLDRARQAFLTSKHYANDPRYLKIWLQYIRLFSDAPCEAFRFLFNRDIGTTLALFYEEYAAWLECQSRWAQAQEVYEEGLNRNARPTERLSRKFDEFRRRKDVVAAELQRPQSPALPLVRPALATKTDSAADVSIADPQQQRTQSSQTAQKKRSNKMAIFSDAAESSQSALGDQNQSTWTGIETLQDRKKENTHQPKAWAGETLKAGKTNSGMPKMAVFKSTSPPRVSTQHPLQAARPGTKRERHLVKLDVLFPVDRPGKEYCFEEVMAKARGWSDRAWLTAAHAPATTDQPKISPKSSPALVHTQYPLHPRKSPKRTKKPGAFEIFADNDISEAKSHRALVPTSTAKSKVATQVATQLSHENDENALVKGRTSDKEEQERLAEQREKAQIAKRLRREERANRTRRIQMDSKRAMQQTQTIQLNMSSPKGQKIKRKKAVEPTMTINTREAMDEIYGILSQPAAETNDQSENEDEDSDSDDDYTSGAESMTTGKLSVAASDYGEETQRELLVSREAQHEEHDESDKDDHEVEEEAAEWTDLAAKTHNADAIDEHECDDAHLSSPIVATPDGTPDENEEFPFLSENVPPVNTSRPPRRQPLGKPNSRLPFMTPIIEHTESSLGTLTNSKREYFTSKTPSRQTKETINAIEEVSDDEQEDVTLDVPIEKLSVHEDDGKRQVLQPLRTKTTRGIVSIADQPVNKPARPLVKNPSPCGPVIRDKQCNPHDPSIRAIVLAMRFHPFDGQHTRLGIEFGKTQDIQRYARTISKSAKGPAAPDKTTNAPFAPRLDFPGSDKVYTLCRELGAGAFAPVYLIEANDRDDDETQTSRMGQGAYEAVARAQLEALKVEETSKTSAWEFHILKLTHERLDVSRAAESIIRAHELHVFKDESYLVEQYRSQGTLLGLVNKAHDIEGIASSTGSGLDEMLAMFFAVELLRTVESLHKRGIIHGDIKGDNVLLRLDALTDESQYPDASWNPMYRADGTHGWSQKGICLIDFGRSINMAAFEPDVQFIAEWQVEAHDCVEMRECRPWTHQVDYHGLAGTVHMLLFGKYMDPVADTRSSAMSTAESTDADANGRGTTLGTKRYKIREPLKRYWQTDLWSRFFAVLLNPGLNVDARDGGRLPITRALGDVRVAMEAWLVENCHKGIGLRTLLRRIEDAVNGRKKR